MAVFNGPFKEIMMFRTIPAIALLLAIPFTAMADKSPDEVSTTVAWRMSLNADGTISALEPSSNTVDALREKLEPVVRSWDFDPGTVNGQPAATQTMLSVQVTLLPQSDDTLAIRLDDIRTGGSVAESKPPALSASVARKIQDYGGYALLIYEISYDQTGAPTEIAVVEGSTETQGRLAKSAEKALQNWRFEPERVAGIGVPGKLIVPICYFAGTSQRAVKRLAEKCTWKHPGSQATVGEGQSLALDSSVHLKSTVVGSIL